MKMNWTERITSAPDVCHGRPCIRSTRIMVSVVLDNLAEGMSLSDMIGEYPSLQPDDIRAAIAYAADLTRERFLTLNTG